MKYSQENIGVGITFLIKLQPFRLDLLFIIHNSWVISQKKMIIAINIKYTKYISGKVRFQNKWRAMATLPPPLPLGVGPAFLILNFNRRSHGSCDYYFCSFTSWKLWKLWPATWEVFLLPFKIDIQWRLHCFDFTKKMIHAVSNDK